MQSGQLPCSGSCPILGPDSSPGKGDLPELLEEHGFNREENPITTLILHP